MPVTEETVSAVGDGVTDDSAAFQAAIDRAVAQGGGRVVVPKGVFNVSGLTVRGGYVTLVGSGRGVTTIRSASSDVITLGAATGERGNNFTLRDVTLRATTGGGHVIRCAHSTSFLSVRGVDLRQDNLDKSVLWFDDTAGTAGGSFIDNHFENCDTWHKSDATVATWHLRGGAINRNRWVSTRCTYSGNYVWWIESTASGSYASQNLIEGVTSEVNNGGLIKLLGCRVTKIANVGIYDLQVKGPTTRDLIVIGSTPVTKLPSGQIVVETVTRHGGTLGAGLFDVKFTTTTGTAGVTMLECGGATPMIVNANGKQATVFGGNLTIQNGERVNGLSTVGVVRSGWGTRPAAATAGVGGMWFDATLGAPIWSTGTTWVRADGTPA